MSIPKWTCDYRFCNGIAKDKKPTWQTKIASPCIDTYKKEKIVQKALQTRTQTHIYIYIYSSLIVKRDPMVYSCENLLYVKWYVKKYWISWFEFQSYFKSLLSRFKIKFPNVKSQDSCHTWIKESNSNQNSAISKA